jgi:hypothetical protein
MVFDNFKVPGNADTGAVDIRQFLPEAHHGSVIVTRLITRSSKVSMGRRMKAGKLEDMRDLSDASHRQGIDMSGMGALPNSALTFVRQKYS